LRSQLEPLQLTEHEEPVQITWQVAPLVQDALPLVPSVTVQVEPSQLTLPLAPVISVHVLPPLHSALHEAPQLPLQLALVQESEQLEPVQPPPFQLQLFPELQVQVDSEQVQAVPGQGEVAVELQPAKASRQATRRGRIDPPI
jgi:hypothetical protein